MDIIEVLKGLGIGEKEARVYLALLKMKEGTASKLAEGTGLDRTLIYQLINRLVEFGLVGYVIKNNVRYFIASNPEKLMESLKEREKNLEKVMPELIRITKEKDEETKVEVYRGREGIKTILKDILKEKKDYVVFGEEGKLQELFPIEFEWFLKDITKLGIKEKVLVREDFRKEAWKTKTSDFRFIGKEYLSPSMTVVYGNKVAVLIWKNPFYVTLTENKEVANSYRGYFELLWKMGEK